jgi:hypothetical protein
VYVKHYSWIVRTLIVRPIYCLENSGKDQPVAQCSITEEMIPHPLGRKKLKIPVNEYLSSMLREAKLDCCTGHVTLVNLLRLYLL